MKFVCGAWMCLGMWLAMAAAAAGEARHDDWVIRDGRLFVDGTWTFLKIGKPLFNYAKPADCQRLEKELDRLRDKGFNALELVCYWHHFDRDGDGSVDVSLEPLSALINAIHAKGMFPCLGVETYGVGGGKLPEGFWKQHPDAMAINAMGEDVRDLEYGFGSVVPSIFHPAYREAVHRFIRALVSGLPHTKILHYETTVEPQFLARQELDFSEAAQRAYESWLKANVLDGPAWPQKRPVPAAFLRDPAWLRFRAEGLADWVNQDAAAFRAAAGHDAYIAVDYLETCAGNMPRRNGDSVRFLESLTAADIIQVNWHWHLGKREGNACAYANVRDVIRRMNRPWAITEHMTLNGSDFKPEDVPALLRHALAEGTGYGWEFVNVVPSTRAAFALYNDDWTPKPLMAEVDDHWPEWLAEIARKPAAR